MTRVLSIWLPHLAIERWAKGSDSPPDACPERSRRAPVVLTVEGTHGPIIHAVTEVAGQEGVRLVMYAGEPQGDGIVSHGPFIGDSRNDIVRLYNEYRAGRFERMSEIARMAQA